MQTKCPLIESYPQTKCPLIANQMSTYESQKPCYQRVSEDVKAFKSLFIIKSQKQNQKQSYGTR